jgi:hypothetical protein
MATMRNAGLLLSLLGCVSLHSAQGQVRPLLEAHAHNDYEHHRPLLDALDQGFCSVEADIYLVDGQLLVAHDRNQVKPERTLQALYLDPLRQRVRANGGRVYANGPEVSILIDIKGKWQATYPVLRQVLGGYAEMLTTFRGNTSEANAVRVILSGDRSREMFAGENVRYACLDGTLADLESNDPASLVPWVSSNWGAVFKWRGTGPFPEEERRKLLEIVTKAHQQGRRVRFWGAPDRPAFWAELLANDVDLINTDDLPGLKAFLTSKPAEKRPETAPSR